MSPILFDVLSLALSLVTFPHTSALASDDFRTREAGQAALTRLLPLSLPALRGAASSKDPEVRRRAEEVLRAHALAGREHEEAHLLADLCRSGYPEWPWIDSLPADYPNRIGQIYRYLAQSPECQSYYLEGDFPEYRRATLLWVRDQFAAGRCRDDILEDLLWMVEGDRRQCLNNSSYLWVGRTPLPAYWP